MHIPYAQTRSYLEQAVAIGKQTAYRAVANANGANQIAIVIPCHRIINNNGDLGGYGGGLIRKKWLIEHEKRSSI
jgi:O-6-methylguanine DNA methyltransferase